MSTGANPSLWRRHAWIAYLAVFLAVMGHASSEFVSVLSGIGGPELSVWRFVLGTVGLVIVALALPESRDLLAPLRARGVEIVLLSLLGVTAAYLMFHWALDFASVAQVATMVTTAPIFVAIVNLAINREAISRAKMAGGAAAFVGVALLLTDGYLARLAGSPESFFGVLLALGCAATMSVFMVRMRPIIAEFGALRMTALSLTIGSLGLWLVVGIAWGIWVDPTTLFERPAGELSALLVLVLYNTTVTQFLWIGGLAAVPDVTRGMYLFFLKPVLAAFLAMVFLSQELSLYEALAIALICGGVALEALIGGAFRRRGVRLNRLRNR